MSIRTREGFRLSPQQQRLWLLQEAAQHTPYRVQCAILIEGGLDRSVLQAAIQQVVDQHEILRTVFELVPGLTIPVQVIGDYAIQLDVAADLSDLPQDEQEARVTARFAALRQRPFDFTNGPLLHLELLKLAEDRHSLLVGLPAVCADAITLRNLLETLARTYTACLRHQKLDYEPVQYADVAEWQHELLESGEADEGRAYWRKRDLSAIQTARLPFEQKANEHKRFQPAVEVASIAPNLMERVIALAQRHAMSTEVVLLAAWQALLHRLSGHAEIVVGAIYPGRAYEELVEVLGPLARSVPIHAQLDPKLSFDDLVARTDANIRDAELWLEYFTWDDVVSGVNGASPTFFPIGFDFQDVTAPGISDAVRFSIARQYICADHFKAKLACTQLDGRLLVEIYYDMGHFSAGDMRRLAEQFVMLLEQVTEGKHTSIGALPLIGHAEHERVLIDFNRTQLAYDRHAPLPRRFEEQVERTPDATAVVYDGQRLTYAELNCRANQLAHYLRRLGVGPEVRVGLFTDRSLEMIVGIIGILKAGGAYVPLDPSYPHERLAYMFADSQARVLLTATADDAHSPPTDRKNGSATSSSANLIISASGGSQSVVDMCADAPAIARESEDNPTSSLTAENLAYVIYTSGSTGKPKGVMIEHYAVGNLVAGLHQHIYHRYEPELRVALIASSSFDASVQQLFAALLLGHTLYVVPDQIRRDGAQLLAYYQDNTIDISDGTPAMLYLLVNADVSGPAGIPVKHFIIGGEELPAALARSFHDRFDIDQSQLTNIYGPAECCVDSTAYLVSPSELAGITSVPIGRPLANKRIYILDAHLNPVPVGVPGELYIAGDGLARGYLGRPDLTAERFIPNPFATADHRPPPHDAPSSAIDGRLYKTGDIGKWQPNGTIMFLGRVDDQVKIRGFRIELQEVEAALRDHPAVRDGLVVVKQKKPAMVSDIRVCTRCFLSSNMPHVTIDQTGVCNVCRDYDTFKEQIGRYFKTEDDLTELFDRVRRDNTSDYDCLLLYSGGKDSTYALYRLVSRGLRVLTFTFDNGFISPDAFDNIKRICAALGVDNITKSLSTMKQVFAESLRTENNVCSGCFRALTSLSTKIAIEKRIPVVVTALSQGQIYETKLAGFIRQRQFEVRQIERDLATFRKMYHATSDRIGRFVNDDVLKDEQAFENILFVDFFRYSDVNEDEILRFLQQTSFWEMPEDTGLSSSNCLINDVGVRVHLRDRGYHYYADQFSWEVRLGHIAHDDALRELHARLDEERITSILTEIGYDRDSHSPALPEAHLCAYVIPAAQISVSELRDDLARVLPDYMLPAAFVFCDSFPLTPNGKVDRDTLPDSGDMRPNLDVAFVAPRSPYEQRLAQIWRDVLGIREIGVHDNFFELGGHSLLATQLMSRLRSAFQVEVPMRSLFEDPTIERLASGIEARMTEKLLEQIERLSEEDALRLMADAPAHS
jgi:amino acid adenylation domain-containing protein